MAINNHRSQLAAQGLAGTRLIGLKGLQGLSGLSEQEQQEWREKNKELLGNNASREQEEVTFNNQTFKYMFGNTKRYDYLKTLPYARREEIKNKVLIDENFERIFKDDNDYAQMNYELDTKGKYDLIKMYNWDKDKANGIDVGDNFFNGSKRIAADRIRKQKRTNERYGKGGLGRFLENMETGMDENAQKEHDQEVKNRLYAETQKRREKDNNITDLTDAYYNQMVEADVNQDQLLNTSYSAANNLFMEKSDHYRTYRDSKWLRDYTEEDVLKDYAKYQALKDTYGEGIADAYLDRSIQNRVAEAQDGFWTGNSLKKVFVSAYSDLGSTIAFALTADELLDAKRMGIIQAGKDPDKPIDKNGKRTYDPNKIIDYEENTNIWTNPQYWNDCYMYNCFTKEGIKLAKENGGVSDSVNVREFGHTADFFSWETMQEAAAQSGHLLGVALPAGMFGKGFSLMGKGIQGGLKLMKVGEKTLDLAAWAGKGLQNAAVSVVSAIPGAQMEAAGQVQENLQHNELAIQNQIQKELQDYSQSVDLNSKEHKGNVDAIFKRLKAEDQRRLKQNKKDQSKQQLPMSDEALYQQAQQEYASSLMKAKKAELEELHSKDRIASYKAVGEAYLSNFALNASKEAFLNGAVLKFMTGKGTLWGVKDNASLRDLVMRGGKAVRNINYASAKNLSKKTAKLAAGGFADEYLDGVNNSFGEGVNNQVFQEYIDSMYNPEAQRETTNAFQHLLAGFGNALDKGLWDRQNWYEGFIGAISPALSGMVNPNVAVNPKQTLETIKSEDAHWTEKVQSVFNNPLLGEIAEAHRQNRLLDSRATRINEVLGKNKDLVDDVSRIVTAYNHLIPAGSKKAGKDNTLFSTYVLAQNLLNIQNDEDLQITDLPNQTVNALKRMANGELAQEEMDEFVNKFLADPDNLSVKNMGTEKARAFAQQRLQKNSQALLSMMDKVQEVNDRIGQSSKLRNLDAMSRMAITYSIVSADNYRERLNNMEKKLEVSETNADNFYKPDYNARYGTTQAKQTAVINKNREIEAQNKTIAKTEEEIANTEQEIKDLKEKEKTLTDKEEKQKNQEALQRSERMLEFQKFKKRQQESTVERMKVELSDLNSIVEQEAPLLSEKGILSLDARDRAAMLDEKNLGNYSKEQQAIIKRTMQNLQQKDPNALESIQDAAELAERVNESKGLYQLLMGNSDMLSTYMQTVREAQQRAAIEQQINSEIQQHYKEIENAYHDYKNGDISEDAYKTAVISRSQDFLQVYMEDHPEQKNDITPLAELEQLVENAVWHIKRNTEKDSPLRSQAYDALEDMIRNARNKEEGIAYLEGLLDSDGIGIETKKLVNGILNSLENIGYLRDATVVKQKEDQLKQQEEQERKRKEAKKKEEEAKKAAVEAAKKAREEAEIANMSRLAQIFTPKILEEVKKWLFTDQDVWDFSSDYTKELPTPVREEILNALNILLKDPNDLKSRAYTVQFAINRGIIKAENSAKMPTEDEFGDPLWSTDNEEEEKPTEESKPETKEALMEEMRKKKNPVIVQLDGMGMEDLLSVENARDLNEISRDEQRRVRDIIEDNQEAVDVMLGGQLNEFIHKAIKGEIGRKGDQGQQRGQEKTAEQEDQEQGKEEQEEQEKPQSTEEKQEEAVRPEDVDELEVHGDEVAGHSLSLEQQMVTNKDHKKEPVLIDNSGENPMEVLNDEARNGEVLSGNAMAEYEGETLKLEGKLVHKKGQEENDSMNKFYTWMSNAGIHLQDIIDNELGYILQKNPNMKVHFMKVNPQDNATHDIDVMSHTFLMIEYDSKVNKGITSIHDESRGGVIESGGKKWLIIGVTGYNPRNEQQKKAFNTILDKDTGIVVKGSEKYFAENKNERYYVSEQSTQVISNSLIPGYRVRQMEEDEKPQYRNIREIVEDEGNPARNPQGFDFESLAWGIQETSKFMVIGMDKSKVLAPREVQRNAGNAFVLIPAGNGKFIPAYIKPTFLSEIKDGKLKNRITRLMTQVLSSKYDDRYNAVIELSHYLYLDKEGNDILLRKSKNEVSLVKDGIVFATFTIDSTLNVQKFIDAVMQMNPRINITRSVIQQKVLLQEYDEAGALQTDIAKIGTAGSSYSIYGLDEKGEMIVPAEGQVQTKENSDSELASVQPKQVVYKGEYYYKTSDGVFYLNGDRITDSSLIAQLQLNDYIFNQSDLTPVESAGLYDYYILSEDEENPQVVKVHKNTKEIVVPTVEQSRKFLQREKQKKEAEQRKKNAIAEKEKEKKAEEEKKKQEAQKKQDSDLPFIADLDLEGALWSTDNEAASAETDHTNITNEMEKKEKKGTVQQEKEKSSNRAKTDAEWEQIIKERCAKVMEMSTSELAEYTRIKPVEDLERLLSYNRDFRKQVVKLVKDKWGQTFKKTYQVMEFLRSKNIEVENINTDEASLQAWIKTVEECR